MKHRAVTAGVTMVLVLCGTLPASVVSGASLTHDRDGDGLRNGWETRWGLTDPGNRDTNGDGVLDSAEDPDGDGLSNLGEQLFKTNPGLADSDGDGISDYLEDSNADGIADGLEQDRRPVPANLKPSLAEAPFDTPVSYSNGCHTSQGSGKIHPCVFGDPNGGTTVAIFGDSHALQWVPALTRAATVNHWRLVAITKSGCPSVDVLFSSKAFPYDRVPCQKWRQKGIAWLGRHVPDLIIIANSRGYQIVDGKGHPQPRDPAWQAGLGRTLAALPAASRRVVIGDTPTMKLDPPRCLQAHLTDISACETRRATAEDPHHDAAERAAADANGASFVSLSALVCSYDPCPILAGNVVMWRNTSHLTATWAKQLWPSLATLVLNALGPAIPPG